MNPKNVIVLMVCAAGVALAPHRARAATDACEGIAIKDGTVTTARRLLARPQLSEVEQRCITAVGAALAERRGVRTVTVAVRLPDALRVEGAGLTIGTAYAQLLAAGGVPEARISTVVPAAAHGEEDSVSITYTERNAARPVARVDSVDGDVSAGPSEAALQPIERGATLLGNTYLATGPSAKAWIELADGSRIQVGPGALLLIGALHLNDDLKRVVKLELKRGTIEADVRSGGTGSVFDVATTQGIAGVRGTRFRLADVAGGMRLETLEGLVDLGDANGHVEVPAGQGALVKTGGPLPAAVVLLLSPTVESPTQGALAPGAHLRWAAVPGASSYRVELARDAEFSYGALALDAPATDLALTASVAGGKWFWRVAAVDGDGFVGRTSKVYAFERVQ